MAAVRGLSARIPPVDGLRALSVLWLIGFHSLWFLGYFLPTGLSRGLERRAAFRILASGHYGVDVFFVISGFLIASLLLGELEAKGRIAILSFYARRAFRILPAYFVAIALTFALVPFDRASAWANLLLVNNFVPFDHQFMPWTWSLAIEEQFYVALPLMMTALNGALRSRRAALAFWGGALALVTATQATLVRVGGFRAMPSAHSWLGPDFARYFDLIYDKPYARGGGLICGVIVALLVRGSRAIPGALAARAGLGVAALALLGLVSGALESLLPAPVFLSLNRGVFTVGTAYVLWYAIEAAPRGLLARCLSWPALRPVAELSYGAFLLHPLVIATLYYTHAVTPAPTVSCVARCLLATLAITFVLAAALYRWVESPARERGRIWAERLAPAPRELTT